MVSPADFPRADEPIASNRGFVTRAWENFFLKLASAESNDQLAALYAALAARVADLESDEALNFQILGQGSISVNGIPQPGGVVIVTLANDSVAPGNTLYYGTGPTGLKGWHAVSTAIAVTSDLDKAVGSNGVTTIGLSAGVLASLALADSAIQSVVAGTNITVDSTDPQNPIISATSGGGIVETIVAGDGIAVDATDPANPIVSSDIALSLPFTLQSGASYIPLTSADELPFFLGNGSPSNIPMAP